jgi:hypothetical protein
MPKRTIRQIEKGRIAWYFWKARIQELAVMVV